MGMISCKLKLQSDLMDKSPELYARVDQWLAVAPSRRIDYWKSDEGWRCQLFEARPRDWGVLGDATAARLEDAISNALLLSGSG